MLYFQDNNLKKHTLFLSFERSKELYEINWYTISYGELLLNTILVEITSLINSKISNY